MVTLSYKNHAVGLMKWLITLGFKLDVTSGVLVKGQTYDPLTETRPPSLLETSHFEIYVVLQIHVQVP